MLLQCSWPPCQVCLAPASPQLQYAIWIAIRIDLVNMRTDKSNFICGCIATQYVATCEHACTGGYMSDL